MPPRLNKRQLREQAELEELAAQKAAAAGSDDDASDDDEQPEVASEVRGGFAALNLGHDDAEESEEEEVEVVEVKKKSKSKKKKKKGKTGIDSADAPSTPSAAGTPAAGKKSAKGQSTIDSPRKGAAAAGTEMDEIDRALAELAAKGGAPIETSEAARPAKLDAKWQAVKEVYAFEPKLLDSDAELRKMFGSKVIQTSAAAPRSMHHARFANNPHHSTSLKRSSSFLAVPEAGWFPSTGVLKLSRYDGPESHSDEGEWYTFDHSWEYRAAQLSFLEVLQQADGNRLYDVLQSSPYHVDTHMQLSEMMVQQGDLGASSTHLSKALYALSAPLPPSFPAGNFRLPYSRIENRAFFLGVSRRVAILVKRGTMRTACEWAKVGLGVAGGQDPVGMLLFLDFLAPKAGQNKWFLSMMEALPKAYAHQPEMQLDSYPGLAYAKALCLRQLEEEEKSKDNTKSTAALTSAVIRFPMIVPLLMATLGGSVPPALLSHRRAQVDGEFSSHPSYLLQLLSALYAVRSAPLWKAPPVLAWLQKTVTATAGSLDDSSLEDVRVGERLWSSGPWEQGSAPAGVIRAASLADIPSIRPYLPPAVKSGTSYSFDPVPPARNSGATYYDDSYFAPLHQARGTRARGQQRGGAGGGGGGGAAGMATAMRDQLAQLLGLGPQGPQVDLNPELRAQLLAELEQLERAGAGGVPGGFPGEEEEDDEGEYTDEEWEEGEEQGDAGAEQQAGFLGRLGALFGGGGGGGAAPPAPQ